MHKKIWLPLSIYCDTKMIGDGDIEEAINLFENITLSKSDEQYIPGMQVTYTVF